MVHHIKIRKKIVSGCMNAKKQSRRERLTKFHIFVETFVGLGSISGRGAVSVSRPIW